MIALTILRKTMTGVAEHSPHRIAQISANRNVNKISLSAVDISHSRAVRAHYGEDTASKSLTVGEAMSDDSRRAALSDARPAN